MKSGCSVKVLKLDAGVYEERSQGGVPTVPLGIHIERSAVE